jgi:hypothetical protein
MTTRQMVVHVGYSITYANRSQTCTNGIDPIGTQHNVKCQDGRSPKEHRGLQPTRRCWYHYRAMRAEFHHAVTKHDGSQDVMAVQKIIPATTVVGLSPKL